MNWQINIKQINHITIVQSRKNDDVYLKKIKATFILLYQHPGGEEVLLEQAGRDASEAFEDVGHSSDARELMKKYHVGDIIEAERKPVKEKPNSWASTSTDDQSSQRY